MGRGADRAGRASIASLRASELRRTPVGYARIMSEWPTRPRQNGRASVFLLGPRRSPGASGGSRRPDLHCRRRLARHRGDPRRAWGIAARRGSPRWRARHQRNVDAGLLDPPDGPVTASDREGRQCATRSGGDGSAIPTVSPRPINWGSADFAGAQAGDTCPARRDRRRATSHFAGQLKGASSRSRSAPGRGGRGL